MSQHTQQARPQGPKALHPSARGMLTNVWQVLCDYRPAESSLRSGGQEGRKEHRQFLTSGGRPQSCRATLGHCRSLCRHLSLIGAECQATGCKRRAHSPSRGQRAAGRKHQPRGGLSVHFGSCGAAGWGGLGGRWGAGGIKDRGGGWGPGGIKTGSRRRGFGGVKYGGRSFIWSFRLGEEGRGRWGI